ncbi:trichohyalin-like isoform X1 [Alosa sapidissima]|uniref:trichohyalin-like isoform X1 n=1 Tax=Alosa sapidissima TaxID=34773 RepID=UPI001C096479|nr:trichohyalin-like isoform X1 [Alosa sapidissima]
MYRYFTQPKADPSQETMEEESIPPTVRYCMTLLEKVTVPRHRSHQSHVVCVDRSALVALLHHMLEKEKEHVDEIERLKVVVDELRMDSHLMRAQLQRRPAPVHEQVTAHLPSPPAEESRNVGLPSQDDPAVLPAPSQSRATEGQVESDENVSAARLRRRVKKAVASSPATSGPRAGEDGATSSNVIPPQASSSTVLREEKLCQTTPCSTTSIQLTGTDAESCQQDLRVVAQKKASSSSSSFSSSSSSCSSNSSSDRARVARRPLLVLIRGTGRSVPPNSLQGQCSGTDDEICNPLRKQPSQPGILAGLKAPLDMDTPVQKRDEPEDRLFTPLDEEDVTRQMSIQEEILERAVTEREARRNGEEEKAEEVRQLKRKEQEKLFRHLQNRKQQNLNLLEERRNDEEEKKKKTVKKGKKKLPEETSKEKAKNKLGGKVREEKIKKERCEESQMNLTQEHEEWFGTQNPGRVRNPEPRKSKKEPGKAERQEHSQPEQHRPRTKGQRTEKGKVEDTNMSQAEKKRKTHQAVEQQEKHIRESARGRRVGICGETLMKAFNAVVTCFCLPFCVRLSECCTCVLNG